MGNGTFTGTPPTESPNGKPNRNRYLLGAHHLVATTASLDAEALDSARAPAEYEQLWADRRAAYEYVPTDDEHWQTALGVQRVLARTSQHRAVGMADLLTATLAAHQLTVIHYDADFETAATVLTFQHQWVLPRGSV